MVEFRKDIPESLGQAITDSEYTTQQKNKAAIRDISEILDSDKPVVTAGHNYNLTRSKEFVVRDFGGERFNVYVYKKEDTFKDPAIKPLNSTYYGVMLQDSDTGLFSDPDTIRIDSSNNLTFIDNRGNIADNDTDLVEFVSSVSSDIIFYRKQRIADEKVKAKANRNSWLGSITVIGGAACIFIGVPYGIYKLQHDQYTRHVDDFDHKNLQLSDGTRIRLGELDKSPAFSSVVANSGDLSLRNVPMIEAGGFQECVFGGEDQRCAGIDSGENTVNFKFDQSVLRTIVMYSTKPGKNCRSVTFSKTPPSGSNIETWTDLGGVTEPTRAQELKVSYKTDGIVACWNGKEKNDKEVARVILRLNR